MTTNKTYRFGVGVHWQGGRMTRASSFDKPDLRIATPPEFRCGVPGVWSPEELVVAAAASCFALTLAAVAERMEVPLHRLDVRGTGELSTGSDRRFGFTSIELVVHADTTRRALERAEEAVKIAEQQCIVAIALDLPLRVTTDVRVAPLLTERKAS
jgi:organic hydroperoxide reductase OsmC/OhrA